MTLRDLLTGLSEHGMEFWKEGERLRYRVAEDVLTPEMLDALKQHKADILALLQDGDVPSGFQPLSYGQQALWFLYHSAPHSFAYNVGFAARIAAPVDLSALRRAFQRIIDRHPCLRSRFRTSDGQPLQQVLSQQEVCFAQSDVSGCSADAIKQRVSASHRAPFHLEHGPLLRVHLFNQAEQGQILLVTIHHIVFDGWSLWILLDELRRAYAAELDGTPPAFAPLPSTYRAYVRKEAETLAGPVGEILRAYWQRKLSGDLPILNLPTDHPRPPLQTFNGASYAFDLDAALTGELRALAQANGATLYMLLLAAFNVLLHRYTGQADLIVGSPNMGRSHAEFEDVIGYFVNMLVLRTRLAGDPSFEALLAQVRQTVLEALEHQDYPFPLLVETLQPVRDPSRSPVFQVDFNVLLKKSIDVFTGSGAERPTRQRGLALEPYELPQQEGQFDLSLELVETNRTLGGLFKYNPDLFEAATIERLAGHFLRLLHGIVENPRQPVSELPILPEAEGMRMAMEWNDTAADYPQNVCLQRLFEAQVARTPDARALRFEHQELSYRELNERADHLAHELRARGVGPDTLVGICLERSVDLVVGVLGILKAGGAYVPLDPNYPDSRLQFILEDADLAVLLTQQHLAVRFPVTGPTILCLDGDQAASPRINQPRQANGVQAENLAYVTYTSGSTGTPKGVQISHRAVVNFLLAMQCCPGFDSHDILLAVTTISFDISGLELLLPLITGGQIVLASQDQAVDGQKLLAEIRRSNVTVMQATPVTWQLLIEAGWEKTDRLKVLCGGEALAPQLAAQLTQRSSDVWNMYGPTETTIWSSLQKIEPEQGRISIGRPIANTQMYILDAALQPVPCGVMGELYIGGDGLARGYWKRPELTAEKFLPDPFRPAARMYRTGDLARYADDGSILVSGRLDHQVKLRGLRIELGDIEANLTAHPAIREAVAIVREDAPGDQRLAAYVIPEHGAEAGVTSAALREYLQTKLPGYMVPSAFIVLPALPLTPNGKVDRRALPAPEISEQRQAAPLAAPTTPTEIQLAQIWSDILHVETIGIHANFFEIGGHSLLALQIAARIRTTFALDVPLQKIFERPTVASAADYIDTVRWLTQSASGVSGEADAAAEEFEI